MMSCLNIIMAFANHHLPVIGVSRLSQRFYYHPYLNWQEHTALRVATQGVEPFPQMGAIINPTLQFPVSYLRIKRRKVTLGKLCTPISTNDEIFHNLVNLMFLSDVKLLKMSETSIQNIGFNQL